MTERHNEDAFDSLIKHAGFDILAQIADDVPDRETILARIGDTDGLDKVMKKTVQKDINKHRRRKVGRVFLRVAAVLLIFLVVSAVAMVSSHAFRTSILNLFYFVDDDDTAKISIVEENDDEKYDKILKPSYLPDGFYLIQETSVNEMLVSIYENANADTITIEQIQGELQMIGEEKPDNQDLEINDRPAFLMENEEFNVLIAYSDYASVTVTADVAISVEDLIKITKSLFP